MFSQFSLSAEYSLWYVPICILVGVAFAYLLYAKNKFNAGLSNRLRVLLLVIRATYLSFLAFLLLTPFFKSSDKELEKPIVIYGEDV